MSNLKVVDELTLGIDKPDPSYEKLRVDALDAATSDLWYCHKDMTQKDFWNVVKAWQRAKVLHDKAKEVNFVPYLIDDPDIVDDMGSHEAKSSNYEAMAGSLGF